MGFRIPNEELKLAMVAAFSAGGTELEDSGEEFDFDVGVYTY